MAEQFSPKSKVQFQLNSRSDLQIELAAITKSRESDDKKCTDEIKRKTQESKDADDKAHQIDFLDRRNIDESHVDRLSLLLDQQFSSSQSDPSSDSGLWNLQGEERSDRILDRADHSWIVQKCQVPGSIPKNHLDVSAKPKDLKNETDKKYNTEIVKDTKKISNECKDIRAPGVKETIVMANNQVVQCPGKKISEKSHQPSKGTTADSTVTMKTLMDEFNDLTKKMSSLKRTLTDLSSCSVNLKPRHSKSYSTDDICMIVDASDVKKVIIDCIAELAAIKNYLDGTEKISSEFRHALSETVFIDCCKERLPHIHGELKKKPTVLTFDTGLPLFSVCREKDVNSVRKKCNSYNSQQNSNSPENLDNSKHKNNYRNEIVARRLELSKKNVGSGTFSIIKKETAVSPVSSMMKEAKKIEEIRKTSAIDEVVFSTVNTEVDSRTKTKSHKWYSCFLDCTREPEDNDFLDSSHNQDKSNELVEKKNKHDKQQKSNEESILRELSVKKSKDQKMLNGPQEKSQIEISIDQKLDSLNVVHPSHGRNNEKTSSLSRKHESPLAILENMDFLYDHYTRDQDSKRQKDTRVFQVYNALVNQSPSDFRQIYTSWLSQPVLNSTIRAAVGLNVQPEFSKIQNTLGASVKNLKKSKSVGFLYFDKSYGTCTFDNEKKTEESNIKKVTGVMETTKRPVQENLLKDIHEFLHYYLKQQPVYSVTNSKFVRKQFQHYSSENPSIVGMRSTTFSLNSKILKKKKNFRKFN
ncbi:uncharacterized protein LOC107268188 isoform X2 [Cephus cinctus]|uniref:Uncharacterized protein LOC107268188 isoform X2 n=1 Tax=Cephus cinctus TaxID=211228 RepID=A0AAJ7RIK9_CEPCN|nr:uncharacterized protein LOC107268188 isoform X2 [Cephus cinctus]